MISSLRSRSCGRDRSRATWCILICGVGSIQELVTFPSPSPEHGHPDELKNVLGRTLGVPLFQEQAMQLAIDAAKFTPDEANGLRRAMATFRNVGTIYKYRDMLVGRMVARGYERDFAERCFKQIEGFGSYGFPESHAASFARLVYISSWIKCHHPAVFACALLNSQPMGFYAPAQIVRDAREHNVEVRPADIGFSEKDNTLERRGDGALALRLGFRQIEGFKDDWGEGIAKIRKQPFGSFQSFIEAVHLPKRALMLLADADAFRSVGLDRRDGVMGGTAHARRQPASIILRPASARSAGRGDRAFACHAAVRACRRRLPDHPAFAQRPSHAIPARAVSRGGGFDLRAGCRRPGRTARLCRRRRAGAPAPGQRQGRRVHDRSRTKPASPMP